MLQPAFDFSRQRRAHADLHRRALRLAIDQAVSGPAVAQAKQGIGRHLQHVIGALHDEFHLDPIAISQRRPLLLRRFQIQNDAGALLFHPQGRHFGKAARLDPRDLGLQRAFSAPARDACGHASGQAHGIAREHFDFDFQLAGVAHFHQGLPHGNGHAAFDWPLEDATGRGRRDRQHLACVVGALCGAPFFLQQGACCGQAGAGGLLVCTGNAPFGLRGIVTCSGLVQLLFRDGAAGMQRLGALPIGLRQALAGLGSAAAFAGGFQLGLGTAHIGLRLAARARVKQRAGGGVDFGQCLACLHRIARLQGNAPHGSGHGRGNHVALLDARFAFFLQHHLQRPACHRTNAGQLGGAAHGQPGDAAEQERGGQNHERFAWGQFCLHALLTCFENADQIQLANAPVNGQTRDDGTQNGNQCGKCVGRGRQGYRNAIKV